MIMKSSDLLSEKKKVMKKLLDKLLETYSYASILGVDESGKAYVVSGNQISIDEDGFSTDMGYVVKVFDGESYCEYATNELNESNVGKIIEDIRCNLVPIKDGLQIMKYKEMEDEEASFCKGTSFKENPEDVNDGSIIDALRNLREKAVKADERLLDVRAIYRYKASHKVFLSKNKDMEQNILWSDCIMAGLAPKGEELKMAFIPGGGLCGVECIKDMEEKIPKLQETIDLLLKSEPMIPGEYDCICTPDVTGLIVHEAFGHAVEKDMFVKDRALAKQYVGDYVASELVTMHDGACCEQSMHMPATYFFDDDGGLAKDTIIIDKGVLKGGICDSLAAMTLGVQNTGNGRREAVNHKSYTRMTNTFFEPGNDKVEDMIKSIDYGFLVRNAEGGMEDPKNWGIQCMASLALEIKDGKLTGKSFSPVTMTGYVPDLLKSISMVSDEFDMSGCGMCGKGHKEWVKVSDGGPYIKAKVRLG